MYSGDHSIPLSRKNLKKKDDYSELSQEQKEFFSQSKAVDDNGDLVIFHHGSIADFSAFIPDYVGRGNYQWGAWFYFTSKRENVEAYVNGGVVKSFYLNLKNPLQVKESDTNLENIPISDKSIKDLIRSRPDINKQPDDEDMNPLGDYIPSFFGGKRTA